jgi:hypothetical protein
MKHGAPYQTVERTCVPLRTLTPALGSIYVLDELLVEPESLELDDELEDEESDDAALDDDELDDAALEDDELDLLSVL